MKARIMIESVTRVVGPSFSPAAGEPAVKQDDTFTVVASPVQAEGSPWTPNAQSQMSFAVIDASEFEVGQEYLIDITLAPAP